MIDLSNNCFQPRVINSKRLVRVSIRSTVRVSRGLSNGQLVELMSGRINDRLIVWTWQGFEEKILGLLLRKYMHMCTSST